ncbi:MAG: MtaA/CmuA family methyltransferase [Actinobacteria bacterium]|nr:MtaA/CmuA family methyltransferase [Actinomycetota bacterium]
MTSKERVLAALAGLPVDRPPVFSANQTATYAQMDACGAEWPEAHQKAESMAKLALAAHSVLGFDAVRAPYCQTVESEALGCTVKYAGREGIPRIDVHAFHAGDEIALPDDFLTRGRVPELIEAVRLMKEAVGDDVAVMGNIVGPFSIVANLIGITDALKASFKKPESLVPLMEVAEQAGTMLGKALVDAGADIIVIEDMMASIDVISPPIFRNLAQPYEAKQIANLPGVLTIMHICGKLNPIMAEVAETGVTAISVEPSVDAVAAKEVLRGFPRHIALIGGVDAVVTLFSGTPEDVKNDVRKALADGYDMIAPGCSVPPSAETENLRAMVEAAEEAAV